MVGARRKVTCCVLALGILGQRVLEQRDMCSAEELSGYGLLVFLLCLFGKVLHPFSPLPTGLVVNLLLEVDEANFQKVCVGARLLGLRGRKKRPLFFYYYYYLCLPPLSGKGI